MIGSRQDYTAHIVAVAHDEEQFADPGAKAFHVEVCEELRLELSNNQERVLSAGESVPDKPVPALEAIPAVHEGLLNCLPAS